MVCKRFQEVHYNAKFVTEILITSSGLYFGKKKVPFSQEDPTIATIKHCLLMHKQYLVKLKISNREDTEQLIQYAIENCPNLVDIEIQAKEILFVKACLNKYMADYCGQAEEKIAEDTDRDFYMSPNEAVKYGLIDLVLDKKPIKV